MHSRTIGHRAPRQRRGAGRGTRPRLGQHFLVSPAVRDAIIAAARLNGTETVLEIGPGRGALTFALAARAARVIAVEKDPRLAAMLKTEIQSRGASNVEMICADIRDLLPARSFPAGWRVVANIPYYLTGRIIRQLLSRHPPPTEILLTIQREVAERVIARPPRMNLLALGIQSVADVEMLRRIPAAAFSPPPRVESALIRISCIEPDRLGGQGADARLLFLLARAAFGHARKTIAGGISTALDVSKARTAAKLREAGIDPLLRPAALSLRDWERLARVCMRDGFPKPGRSPTIKS